MLLANDMAELASHHKASVVVRADEKYTFETRELPLPEPGPSDVLVKLSVSGICGSDVSLASGILGPTRDILGHEGIGRVIKLGAAVSPDEVKIGQRVAVAWIRDACGTCSVCLHEGGETRCRLNITSGQKVDGTFAEYTVVPLRYILQIPEGVSDELLAPITCGGVTIYKALKISEARAGQWVAISGAGGGLGALGIQYAKAMGLRVVAIDLGHEKKGYCIASGAEVYIDLKAHSDVPKAVVAATEGVGCHAAIVCSGAIQAYQDAMGMLAPFGVLVCVGIPPPIHQLKVNPIDFIHQGYKIVGSAVGTRGDILEAMDFVARGVVVPVVHMTTLDGLTEVSKLIKAGQAIGKYVIRFDYETMVTNGTNGITV